MLKSLPITHEKLYSTNKLSFVEIIFTMSDNVGVYINCNGSKKGIKKAYSKDTTRL